MILQQMLALSVSMVRPHDVCVSVCVCVCVCVCRSYLWRLALARRIRLCRFAATTGNKETVNRVEQLGLQALALSMQQHSAEFTQHVSEFCALVVNNRWFSH